MTDAIALPKLAIKDRPATYRENLFGEYIAGILVATETIPAGGSIDPLWLIFQAVSYATRTINRAPTYEDMHPIDLEMEPDEPPYTETEIALLQALNFLVASTGLLVPGIIMTVPRLLLAADDTALMINQENADRAAHAAEADTAPDEPAPVYPKIEHSHGSDIGAGQTEFVTVAFSPDHESTRKFDSLIEAAAYKLGIRDADEASRLKID